jgi:hypothetical protein
MRASARVIAAAPVADFLSAVHTSSIRRSAMLHDQDNEGRINNGPFRAMV